MIGTFFGPIVKELVTNLSNLRITISSKEYLCQGSRCLIIALRTTRFM